MQQLVGGIVREVFHEQGTPNEGAAPIWQRFPFFLESFPFVDNLPGIDVVAAGVVGADRQVLDMLLLLNFQRSGILIF